MYINLDGANFNFNFAGRDNLESVNAYWLYKAFKDFTIKLRKIVLYKTMTFFLYNLHWQNLFDSLLENKFSHHIV